MTELEKWLFRAPRPGLGRAGNGGYVDSREFHGSPGSQLLRHRSELRHRPGPGRGARGPRGSGRPRDPLRGADQARPERDPEPLPGRAGAMGVPRCVGSRLGAARRLTGTRVTTYALHPGAVASNIWRSLPRPLQWFGKLFMLSNEQGAESPLYCATAPELAATTGRYYDRTREARPSPLAEDAALAQELWARTETPVGPAT